MCVRLLSATLAVVILACNQSEREPVRPPVPQPVTKLVQAMGPADFVAAGEAKEVLGSNEGVSVFVRNDGDETIRSYRYVGVNDNVLTLNVFLEKGKEAFDIQTFGRDDPRRSAGRRCEGIGDVCYRPNQTLLHVLKGDVCFTMEVATPHQWPGSLNLLARDALAHKIVERLP